MKKPDKKTVAKVQSAMLSVGLLMMFVAAAFPLLGLKLEYLPLMRYVFAAGAVVVLAVRLTEVYEGSNFRVRRLHSLEKVSALLYCVSAFLLFFYGNKLGGGDWIAFLLAGAVIQIYTSFMIQHEENKARKQEK